MYSRGHEGVSLLLYAPIALLLMLHSQNDIPLAVYGGLVVWELRSFPDNDMTWKNYHIPIPTRGGRFGITFTSRSLVKHRGITHTIWFALLLVAPIAGVLGGFLSKLATYFGNVVFFNPQLFLGIVALTVIMGELAEFIGGVLESRAVPLLILISLLGIIELPVIYPARPFIGFTVFAAVFGILAHIVGDMLTPTGVRPLDAPWPFSKLIPYHDTRITVNVTKASNTRWNIGLWIAGYLTLTIVFLLGDSVIRTALTNLIGF